DLVFPEDNRAVAAQIVQLSFDFARADASLGAKFQAGSQIASAAIASGSAAKLAHFAELENRVDLASQQANQEVETIKKELVTARGTERRTLQAALDVTQRRLDLLLAGLASLRELVDFVQVTAGRQTDLTSSIEELGRKLRILDDEIGRTDKLRQSSDDVRSPLLAYANKRLPIDPDNNLQASDLGVLQQQKAELDALIAVAKTLAPAMVALDKQIVLLSAYISRLKTWRATVENENAKIWRSLILRVVGVAVVIGVLLLIGAAARSLTDRHVRDAERRHVIRVIERVVPWFMIVLVAALSFTSDLTSLATFFGLLTAGVAIALQSVILSALGYFLLVGKRGIRVGDRAQISGVTGNVIDIGWLQFRLQEIDNETQQPTGHVVTFSNSFVFVSPATG